MKKGYLIIFLILACQGNILAQNHWIGIDSIRVNLSNAKEDTIRVHWYAEIASYYKFKRLDSTQYYGDKAIKLARKINYPAGESTALLQMSLSQGAFGNESQALSMCLQAISIADKNDLTYIKGLHLLQLGKIYTKSKNYAKAIESYRESISHLGNSKTVRLVQVRMGETFLLMNELDSALYYCQPVYDREVQTGTLHALTLYMLGRIQEKMGHVDLALDYLHRSMSGGYDFDINYAIAQIYQRSNKVDSCIFYAKKSLEIAKESGFYSNIIDASVLLSDVFENEDPSKALQYNRLAKAYTDSLYTMGKLASLDNLFEFDEQERQHELEAAKTSYRSQVQRIWIFSISGGLISAIILAMVLYRNNKSKQKANAALKEQKEEIQSALEKLESTQSQLIQSEKMASLGELTAGIAHEIQNPLNFVNNFSEVNAELAEELLVEIKKGNVQGAEAITTDIINNEKKIVQHGKRADAIVKGMLQHSRSANGAKELTDINALADEYLRLAYHGLRAKDKGFNANFKTDLDPSLPKINVVPQDMGRVLLNLINNAFHAVSAEALAKADSDYKPEVIVSTKMLGDKIEIRVSDNGPGIPDNIKDKIFQPFFTTKPTGQGTGLGLSLSYDIVKAHGGELKVESKVGESLPSGQTGTVFIIHLSLV